MSNESRKLAVCIPTFERSLVINDFLYRCVKLYISKGIDVYIYDSSVNNDTYSVCDEWITSNPSYKNNFFYQRVDSSIHANAKVYEIFQGEGLKYTYDFIWVCGDAIQVQEWQLETILKHLDYKYDIIQVNSTDVENIGIKEYTDYDECVKDCVWQMTLFGAVILNRKKMLADVDWDYFERKYLTPQYINYSHVSFYLGELYRNGNFCVLHLGIDDLKYSAYKLKSGWVKDTIFIMFDSWYNTIKDLPCGDEAKENAMKKLPLYSVLKSDKDFLKLKAGGAYNFKDYRKYRNRLETVCNIDRRRLFWIAVCPKFIVNIQLRRTFIHRFILKRKIGHFFKRYSDIYIYGAGYYGALYGQYCYDNNIEFRAYCVKSGNGNYKKYYNHPVIELEQLQDKKEAVGIVIALANKTAVSVEKELKNKGYRNIFHSKYFTDVFY